MRRTVLISSASAAAVVIGAVTLGATLSAPVMTPTSDTAVSSSAPVEIHSKKHRPSQRATPSTKPSAAPTPLATTPAADAPLPAAPVPHEAAPQAPAPAPAAPAPAPPAPAPVPQAAAPTSQSVTGGVLAATNTYRRQAGLPELVASGCGESVAAAHSIAQAASNSMYHQDLGNLFAACGGGTVGENVAYGYGSASAVAEGWYNSPGHRANMLNPSFRSMSAAVAYSANGTPYYTQVFFG